MLINGFYSLISSCFPCFDPSSSLENKFDAWEEQCQAGEGTDYSMTKARVLCGGKYLDLEGCELKKITSLPTSAETTKVSFSNNGINSLQDLLSFILASPHLEEVNITGNPVDQGELLTGDKSDDSQKILLELLNKIAERKKPIKIISHHLPACLAKLSLSENTKKNIQVFKDNKHNVSDIEPSYRILRQLNTKYHLDEHAAKDVMQEIHWFLHSNTAPTDTNPFP
ncbi:hypothetical protein [Candidatus Fukatsuia endosymbiont of Tuberolachnus salignus]|uniref:hypothetical protein n=1 Tax=Candidatus Fukatsuia endosymbiont of Tuberolachnus salignus TaxID=3077957 RepID=UPI00313E01BF